MAKLEEWTYTGGKSVSVVTTSAVMESAEAKAARWAQQKYTSEEWLEMQKAYRTWAQAMGIDDGSTFGLNELGL